MADPQCWCPDSACSARPCLTFSNARSGPISGSSMARSVSCPSAAFRAASLAAASRASYSWAMSEKPMPNASLVRFGGSSPLRRSNRASSTCRCLSMRAFGQAFAVAARAREWNGALESGRHERTDARTLAFDQRVRSERRRVAHRVHLRQQGGRLQTKLFARVHQRVVEALCKVVMRGQRLAFDIVVVPDDETVGKSAADIHRDSFHGRPSVLVSRLRVQRAPVLDLLQRQVRTDLRLQHFLAVLPLQLERIDIELDVVQRRMTRRQVFGLDHGSASRAIILEDAAPRRVGRIGALVLCWIQQGFMDLAGITVVDQETAFVVAARGSVRPAAAPAFPLLGFEIDAQVFSDEDFHERSLSITRETPECRAPR